MKQFSENIHRFGSLISCGLTRTIRRMSSSKLTGSPLGLRTRGLGVGLGLFILGLSIISFIYCLPKIFSRFKRCIVSIIIIVGFKIALVANVFCRIGVLRACSSESYSTLWAEWIPLCFFKKAVILPVYTKSINEYRFVFLGFNPSCVNINS